MTTVESAPAATEGETGFPPAPLNGIDALALTLVALSLLVAGAALRRLSSSG
ncbi:MAG: hypothetical protein ACR2OC_12920 [Solirubrobacterales bacterium]